MRSSNYRNIHPTTLTSQATWAGRGSSVDGLKGHISTLWYGRPHPHKPRVVPGRRRGGHDPVDAAAASGSGAAGAVPLGGATGTVRVRGRRGRGRLVDGRQRPRAHAATAAAALIDDRGRAVGRPVPGQDVLHPHRAAHHLKRLRGRIVGTFTSNRVQKNLPTTLLSHMHILRCLTAGFIE